MNVHVQQGQGICVSGGLDGLAVVWDARRGAMQHVLCRGSDPIVDVAVDEEVYTTALYIYTPPLFTSFVRDLLAGIKFDLFACLAAALIFVSFCN